MILLRVGTGITIGRITHATHTIIIGKEAAKGELGWWEDGETIYYKGVKHIATEWGSSSRYNRE